MKRFNIADRTFPRILLASAIIVCIVGVAGRNISPATPLGTWLLYCLLGAIVFGGSLLVLAIVHLAVGQFVLRKGGADSQWHWFDNEPLGLVRLRERIRSQKQERKQESRN